MTNQQHHKQVPHSIVKCLFLLYLLFVVYGSLVPLKYVHRSLDDAILAFQNIRYLNLGVASRADWIANGVLYAPLGFLAAILLMQNSPRALRVPLLAIAGIFSIAVAVGVEFTQLYFPQRTVSLNDIMAECLGTIVGLAFAFRYATWFQRLLESFSGDPQRLKTAVLGGYCVAYLAFVLFPYDILLSWTELEAKIASDSWGWFVSGNSPRSLFLGLQLLGEIVLTAPLGFLVARRGGSRATSFKQAALIGTLLGASIEISQFFIASGISQGLSVLTRAIGLFFGLAITRQGPNWPSERIMSMLTRYTLPLAAAYLMVLLEINGWFTADWQGWGGAAKQWGQLSFMPFYYHYFTTEAKALFSLSVVCFSYVPIAILVWAHRRSPSFALFVSLSVATFIEAGKLFLLRSHPDPTNVLLASAVGWVTVRLLGQLFSKDQDRKFVATMAMSTSGAQEPRTVKTFPIWLWFSFAATAVWVVTFPVFSVFVCLVLVAGAVTVWHRPVWVFAIIPAGLPVFDLAPWSGRFFLDEFDALLLVGLAVAYARVPALPKHRMRVDGLFTVAASLVALSFAISAVRGMLPFQLPDANSFNNYYSPYNALRIVKGGAWAFLIYSLSKRFVAVGVDVRRSFFWGMAAGLAITVAVILWERVAFSGLWNFSADYRVTGPFSAMHTGGAYIECFVAVATPFLISLMLEKRHWLVRFAGMLLLLTTTYALMVTFSRNGYTAFAVAVGIVLLVALFNSKRVIRSGVIFTGFAGAMLLVAVPIFKGDFSQSRMATVSADLSVRKAHWEDGLSIRDPDWVTSLFGMGLGRFPETNYWRSSEDARSATYRLENDAGNTYLRLGSGAAIYVEQLVAVEPGRKYRLKLDVRPNRPDANIVVPICEKWMLTSYNCIWQSINLGKEFGAWRSIEAHINTNELASSRWYSQRPIKLALYYNVAQSTIDIDNVRLENESGIDLIRNGDFSERLDHWFFSTDSHLQWHIKSLSYGVLFDQGWLGLVALWALFSLGMGRAAKNAFRGDNLSGASLAALSSFLVVGLFDTLIDDPRFLLAVLLLAFFSAANPVLQPKPHRQV